jgi:hypothetical protein
MPEKKGNINRRNNNYEHDAHVPTVHERQDQCYDNIFQRVSYLELYSRHSYRVRQNVHHLQNCSWLVIMYVVVVSFLLWLFRSSLLDNGLHNNGNGEGFGFWSSVAVSRSRKRGLLPLWSVLVGHSDGWRNYNSKRWEGSWFLEQFESVQVHFLDTNGERRQEVTIKFKATNSWYCTWRNMYHK